MQIFFWVTYDIPDADVVDDDFNLDDFIQTSTKELMESGEIAPSSVEIDLDASGLSKEPQGGEG